MGRKCPYDDKLCSRCLPNLPGWIAKVAILHASVIGKALAGKAPGLDRSIALELEGQEPWTGLDCKGKGPRAGRGKRPRARKGKALRAGQGKCPRAGRGKRPGAGRCTGLEVSPSCWPLVRARGLPL